MSDEKDLAMVKQNGLVLEFIENQTPEICLAAVKQDAYALQHVKEQTEAICLAAVKQSGYALKFVKEQTPAICLVAVKQYGIYLGYVKDQTSAICLAAVQQDVNALVYVKDLYTIADKIDESIIGKGLNSEHEAVVLACQKLIKIREANAIANQITAELMPDEFNLPEVKVNPKRLKL